MTQSKDNNLDFVKEYYNKDLGQKKVWYSKVAEDYNKVRPRYPQKLVDRVLKLTQLNPSVASILEVGCGPGNATISFAKLGFSMVCIEPNFEFYQLAKENCQHYSNVKIINSSFEEWQLEEWKFDGFLAANSFHWIGPKIGYSKATEALKKDGFLILLWNTQLEPNYEICQELEEVYQIYAPSLGKYEGRKTQENILKTFGENIINSGQFKDLTLEFFPCQVIYNTEDYLALLNTFSPYIKLDSQARNNLFQGLREKIDKDFGGSLELSYLSAFHLARKS